MVFSVSVTYEAGVLRVKGAGPATLADLCGLASLGGTVSQLARYPRVLVDLQETQPQLSFTDHIQLGTHFAHEFRQAERVATVVSQKDRVGTSEKAAQRSGLTLQTFTELAPASEWLAGGS